MHVKDKVRSILLNIVSIVCVSYNPCVGRMNEQSSVECTLALALALAPSPSPSPSPSPRARAKG